MRALRWLVVGLGLVVGSAPARAGPDEPPDGRAQGRIVAPAGARMSDVVAYSGDARLTIAPDGTFRYRPDTWLARPIEAKVWVGERFYRAVVRPKANVETVLTLVEATPPPHLRLEITDPEGAPVPSSRYRVFDGVSQHSGEARDGVLVLEARSSETRFTVSLWDFRDAHDAALPLQRVREREFGLGPAKVTLERARTIEGRVRTTAGRPVAGVELSAWEQVDDEWKYVTDAQTDAAGRFRLVGLASTPHRIEVGDLPDAFDPPEPLPLAADATTTDVVVEEKVAPLITVTDADGKPLMGARARLFATEVGDVPRGELVRTTAANGSAEFPLLSPRTPFLLRVVPPGDAHLPKDVPDWRAAPTAVRLERAFVVHGRVRGPDAHAVPSSTVWVRAAPGAPGIPETWSFERIESGYVLGAVVERDGSFRAPPLPETTLEVFAAHVDDAGRETRSAVVTVRPGDPPFDLAIAR